MPRVSAAGSRTRSTQAIKLQPKHADAHIALGAWHAEIIGKVGGMVGGLTYGAKKDAALEHFQKALKLNPDSAIARIEYANGLVTLFGKDKLKEAEKLYAEAAKQKPMDAMERLDVEAAKAELETRRRWRLPPPRCGRRARARRAQARAARPRAPSVTVSSRRSNSGRKSAITRSGSGTRPASVIRPNCTPPS